MSEQEIDVDLENPETADFEAWVKTGIENGWVGPPICYTHDGLPTSELEDEEFSSGDPCVHILRLYDDADLKAAVEANHGPSVWRATNRGIDI